MTAATSMAAPASSPDRGRKRRRLAFTLGLIMAVLSLCAGLATYLVVNKFTSIVPTDSVVTGMLLINTVPVLAMIVIIAWQVTELWIASRRHIAGAQLQLRTIGLFSVIALAPAILVAILAGIAVDSSLNNWFSARTQSIIQNSSEVAADFVRQQGEVMAEHTFYMAREIDDAVRENPLDTVIPFVKSQAASKKFPYVYLINGEGKILAVIASHPNVPYKVPPNTVMALAKTGKSVPISRQQTNTVGAIKSLTSLKDTYLYVLRPVSESTLKHVNATSASVDQYKEFEKERSNHQLANNLMYAAITLAFILSAIWLSLWFAGRLVAPIRQLIGAAKQVSQGNLAVNVDVRRGDGDLALLGSTFNTMTTELKNQRDELVGANSKLDERRRFMEAVMSGVTAGVVGIDNHGVVTLVNRSAKTLLEIKEADLVGHSLAKAVPEFGPVLKRAQKQGRRLVTDHVTLRRHGSERNFAVRVTSEGPDQDTEGFVVTFDDMTELVSAQRSTAWADVARRIAHEIKNPLTPIQLSAERIRRKYGDTITKDRDVFDQCTNTIIRQVSDIGRMVDEFSSFARMPKPVMEPHDVREIVREAVFLYQVSRPEMTFELELPDKPVMALLDRRLIAQAVTNLVKNASEAIDTSIEADPARAGNGRILAQVGSTGDRAQITIIDNGCGLPKANRQRLVEPYMTTRTKGTGLGLAIVQRITEQHGGTLSLADAPKRNRKVEGASVQIDFPIGDLQEKSADAEEGAPEAGASTPSGEAERTAEVEEEEGVTHGI
jgi:two-component system nitrogen regulation sensor histidine kinase NtrY